MKRYASTIAAGLLLVLASSAQAAGAGESSNPTERARASFHHGVQLYNEGSFEAALAEFRKAYQFSPNYRLLYNIAQTYYDLHDYVSSSKSLKQYVQEGGNELSATRRTEVNELNQKLDERIAYLDIVCNLDGADIRVDDLSVGVSPLTSVVPVNAGPRRITAIKLGHPVAGRMATVVGREKAKVVMDIPALIPMQVADPVGSSPAVDAASESTPIFIQGERTRQKAPLRVGLITSSVVAGGCAIATGIFGFLALSAKDDFNHELGKIPNTKGNVDSARSKMTTYAHLTDGFGAATLVSGGVALYFFLTDSGSKKSSSAKSSVALAPTVGGMLLHGEW
jgi:tetratricopeptide (TPR) repeat protein